MIELINNYWAVEVPDNARNIGIAKGYIVSYQTVGAEVIHLPPGTWEIVCTSKSATEEQAAGIVEKADEFFYKCYDGKRPHSLAIGSLGCLLLTKGCDTKLNWLILKKQ